VEGEELLCQCAGTRNSNTFKFDNKDEDKTDVKT